MLKYHIQTIEVGSGGAGSIAFNGINADYDDLLLVLSGRSTRTGFPVANVQVSFNGTSTNESFRMLRGRTPNTVETSASTGIVLGHIPSASNTASTFSNSSLYISNYASSVAKAMSIDVTAESNNTADYSSFIEIYAGLWDNTSPIISISLTPDTGNFAQYSSASLYGIKHGSDGVTLPAAYGGTVTQSGGYTTHTFTTSGTFVANRDLQADVLVVAGGGAGGSNIGGGGGAGGCRDIRNQYVPNGAEYFVAVGAGGAGNGEQLAGNSGSNSFFGLIAATGGGGGAGNDVPTGQVAKTGGSGGGGSYNNQTGATGNIGNYSPSEGNNGGNGQSAVFGSAGGGGGATQAGIDGNSSANVGGEGGAGLLWLNSLHYAGGGGGGRTVAGTSQAALGGTGGGGNGGYGTSPNAATNPTAGSTNLGGGGGGAGWGSAELGANGGSGVVIIRYLTPA